MTNALFCTRTHQMVLREDTGVEDTCGRVAIEVVRHTPTTKFLGINQDTYGLLALSLEFPLGVYDAETPNREGAREIVAICHDPSDGCVILEAIPRNSIDFDGGLVHAAQLHGNRQVKPWIIPVGYSGVIHSTRCLAYAW